MAVRKLPTIAQRLIVKALAYDYMPMEVVRLIQDRFDITITRQTVEYYDPRKSKYIKPEWETYFLEQLALYNQKLDNCRLEHHAYRQKLRGQLYDAAVEQNNIPLALRIIESARKEACGEFVSKTSRSKRRKWKPST